MAVVAFDPLEYAQQLEAAGMPRAQAEVVAKGLTTMFIHNFDALVTKDYLDTRFQEFEARMGLSFAESESRTDTGFAAVDSRFAKFEAQMDARFTAVNSRFAEFEALMDVRFAAVDSHFTKFEARMDARFATVDLRFARADVMLGVIMVALAIPVLQTLLVWFR